MTVTFFDPGILFNDIYTLWLQLLWLNFLMEIGIIHLENASFL